MANRYFSLPLGGQKKDVTNSATTTSGDAIEIRVDEAQIVYMNDIRKALDDIFASIIEQQRYG